LCFHRESCTFVRISPISEAQNLYIMAIYSQIRNASHPADAKHYDTQRLRDEHLVSPLFTPDDIRMVYSMYDRYVVGGIHPVKDTLELEPVDALKSAFFLHRREIGIINVGGPARILVDGKEYLLNYKEALFIGQGDKKVTFASTDAAKPAKLYFNSAPAHKAYPDKKVTLADATVRQMGSQATSNERKINQLIINQKVDTCQLQMGMTELQTGSVWNTMPPHTHSRRMEAYFYFEVPEGQAVCHFMGEPQETRHIWMQNDEAVISPSWSIHSAAGTSNYTFIWGMAGENLEYDDMDICQPNQLR